MALIVLAGGKSSRMGGGDKAQLPLGERTMIGQSIARLGKHFSQVIVVAKDLQPYQELPVQVVLDTYPECGPIGGIHAGLLASADEYNLVLGCDLPLVKEELVTYLLRRAMGVGKQGTLPEIGDRLEPLVGVYHSEVAITLEKAILAETYQLQQVLRQLDLDLVQEKEIRKFDPDLVSFMNVNTPEDYQRVQVAIDKGI